MSDSNKIKSLPKDPSHIDQEAATWLARQDKGTLTPLQKKAFEKWYRESDLHRHSYDKLSSFWAGIDRLRTSKETVDETLLEPTLLERLGIEVHHRVIASAAAFVFALTTALTYFYVNQIEDAKTQYAQQEYRTVIGDQRNVSLPDGSSVLLNTASHILIAYSPSQRMIHLVEGEAFFKVESDPSRPFLVKVGNRVVSAVGTAFTVLRNTGGIDVTVTEGDVELFLLEDVEQPLNALDQQPSNIQLTARETVKFTKSVEPVKVVSNAEMNRKLAWRQGILAFAGEPLPEVIAEISRYTDLKIIITDTSLAELRFGGVLKIGNIDSLFSALEQSFGVRIDRKQSGEVFLSVAEKA